MASINSFPNNQDVYIGAEPVMRWLHGRTSGVFGGDGNLAVEAVSGSYAVTVSDGTGWMSNDNADGVVVWIDNEDRTQNKLQLQPTIANATLPRIDRVVISWETTDYVDLPTVTILAGTPASSPTPPTLTNNNLMRQISLARIRIPAGATQITSDMITDERLDESVCGIVTGTVQFDTTVMQAQFTALLNLIQQQLAQLNAGTSTMQKSVYDKKNRNTDVFDAMVHLYKATLDVDNWQYGRLASGGDRGYYQRVSLTAMDGGPSVTATSQLLSGVMCEQTAVAATNDTLQDVLALINAGRSTIETYGGQVVLNVGVFEKPTADIEAIWQIKQGVS